MKRILLAALVTPGAAMAHDAAELWCMPSKICVWDGRCHKNTDTEQSMRLHDWQGASPMMRVHAESIAMTRTKDGEQVQWQGQNQSGEVETLTWRMADGAFAYIHRAEDGRKWKATGRCEVQ